MTCIPYWAPSCCLRAAGLIESKAPICREAGASLPGRGASARAEPLGVCCRCCCCCSCFVSSYLRCRRSALSSRTRRYSRKSATCRWCVCLCSWTMAGSMCGTDGESEAIASAAASTSGCGSSGQHSSSMSFRMAFSASGFRPGMFTRRRYSLRSASIRAALLRGRPTSDALGCCWSPNAGCARVAAWLARLVPSEPVRAWPRFSLPDGGWLASATSVPDAAGGSRSSGTSELSNERRSLVRLALTGIGRVVTCAGCRGAMMLRWGGRRGGSSSAGASASSYENISITCSLRFKGYAILAQWIIKRHTSKTSSRPLIEPVAPARNEFCAAAGNPIGICCCWELCAIERLLNWPLVWGWFIEAAASDRKEEATSTYTNNRHKLRKVIGKTKQGKNDRIT